MKEKVAAAMEMVVVETAKEVVVMVMIRSKIALPSSCDLPLSFSGVKATLRTKAATQPTKAMAKKALARVVAKKAMARVGDVVVGHGVVAGPMPSPMAEKHVRCALPRYAQLWTL